VNIILKKLNQFGFDHIFMAIAFVVILGIVGSGYVVIKGHSAKGVSHAAAGYGHTFCGGNGAGCLNAWNGGPWVNSYGNAHVGNDDFYSVSLSNGASTYIMDSGVNVWGGKCIGDAYNQSGNPLASLDSCPGSSQGAGWGTIFKVVRGQYCTGNTVGFLNRRWNDFLAPADGVGFVNGMHFTLKGSIHCFQIGPAV